MYTTYRKIIGKRIAYRYFKDYDNAQRVLLDEIEDLKARDCEVTARENRIHTARGFYEYTIEGRTTEGELFSLSLIVNHFED